MDSTLLLLMVFSFFAGFVDSIVGGGGLVQIPAFFVLYPQLSVASVLGTNRMASAVGTSVAAWNYARTVSIPWKMVAFAGICASICSFLGATLQSYIASDVLKPIILILIIGIALYTFGQKNLGQLHKIRIPEHRMPFYLMSIGGLLGFYNGMIGPGTGSLLVFAFVSIIGFGFLQASAISKVVNVIADVSSLVFFVWNGKIIYPLVLPLMVSNVAGSFLGSKLAILKGNQFIRVMFLMVTVGIIARFGWDIWHGK